jgi:hypothetical protein
MIPLATLYEWDPGMQLNGHINTEQFQVTIDLRGRI